MFRKTMLIGVVALAAAVVMAQGAQADAPQWYHEGIKVGEGSGNGRALHVTGELAWAIPGASVISGPCEVTFEGEAWNENGMADGVVTGGTIQEECETNIEGCTLTVTLQNFPWDITGMTVTEEPGLGIIGFQTEYHYMNTEACPFEVSTFMTTGTLTGIAEEDVRCLSYEEHSDDLWTHAPLPTIAIDTVGKVCDTTLELG